MKTTIIFQSILLVYLISEYIHAPKPSNELTVAAQLVNLYVVALIYLLFLGAISIQVALWRERGRPSTSQLVIEKTVFIYALLLWRNVYSPSNLLLDHFLLALASILALLWMWKSSTIAAGVVTVIRKTTPNIPAHLVPGSSHGQRLFNCALGLVFIAALPFLFRHAESIFGPAV